jgi:hypothetical protein
VQCIVQQLSYSLRLERRSSETFYGSQVTKDTDTSSEVIKMGVSLFFYYLWMCGREGGPRRCITASIIVTLLVGVEASLRCCCF